MGALGPLGASVLDLELLWGLELALELAGLQLGTGPELVPDPALAPDLGLERRLERSRGLAIHLPLFLALALELMLVPSASSFGVRADAGTSSRSGAGTGDPRPRTSGPGPVPAQVARLELLLEPVLWPARPLSLALRSRCGAGSGSRAVLPQFPAVSRVGLRRPSSRGRACCQEEPTGLGHEEPLQKRTVRREEGTDRPPRRGAPQAALVQVAIVHIGGDAGDPLLSPGWKQSCNADLWLQTPDTERLWVRVAGRALVAAEDEGLLEADGARNHRGRRRALGAVGRARPADDRTLQCTPGWAPAPGPRRPRGCGLGNTAPGGAVGWKGRSHLLPQAVQGRHRPGAGPGPGVCSLQTPMFGGRCPVSESPSASRAPWE